MCLSLSGKSQHVQLKTVNTCQHSGGGVSSRHYKNSGLLPGTGYHEGTSTRGGDRSTRPL